MIWRGEKMSAAETTTIFVFLVRKRCRFDVETDKKVKKKKKKRPLLLKHIRLI